MIMIVGLGNPGKEFANTRHNVGWKVVDALASNKQFSEHNGRGITMTVNKRFSAYIGKGELDGTAVLLVKPTTMMNLSGQAVKKICQYYRLESKDIWVVSDDIDLPIGWIRVRQEGSAGGHKGLQSVIDYLGTQDLVRFRLGITPFAREGREVGRDLPQAEIYVLESFNKEESTMMEKVYRKATDIIIDDLKGRQIDSHTYSAL